MLTVPPAGRGPVRRAALPAPASTRLPEGVKSTFVAVTRPELLTLMTRVMAWPRLREAGALRTAESRGEAGWISRGVGAAGPFRAVGVCDVKLPSKPAAWALKLRLPVPV